MKIRLFPKDEKFFELFRRDASNLKQGVEALQDLVNHYGDIDKKYQKIKAIEHQGDILTHDIITRLRGTFITPLEREDIHALASGLDDVLDCIEGVASRLNFYKIGSPSPEMKKLVGIISQAVSQIYEAISHLEKLGHVHTFCNEVNKLEYQADIIGQQAIADLFENTQRVEDLKELIKLKEIYERLERAADRCEDVANVIEGITVKMT
jgi:predicted phosphate transport protein (TIGR00153 family)